MMSKKFMLSDEKKQIGNVVLFRVKALINTKFFKKGELGGWIEKESNLSQDGDAWVYNNAQVSGNAWIYGNARVYGDAWIYGDAQVSGNARVSGDARVCGKVRLQSVLYSRFIFKFDWQIELWKKKEKEFEKENVIEPSKNPTTKSL